MAQQPLVYVGDRLAVLGAELAELARQRDALDARIEGVLAEVRALGVPGAMVPSPNGTADAGGPRLPVTTTTALAPTTPLVKTSPWPREDDEEPDAKPVALPVHHRQRHEVNSHVNRVLRVVADSPEPITAMQVAATLKEPIPRVRDALKDLFRRYDRIDAPERGLWVVTDHGRRHLEWLATPVSRGTTQRRA
jgi:hypothetical protein